MRIRAFDPSDDGTGLKTILHCVAAVAPSRTKNVLLTVLLLLVLGGCGNTGDTLRNSQAADAPHPAEAAQDEFGVLKETEHFRFHCEPENLESVNAFAAVLERRYAGITEFFKIRPASKIIVRVYPTRARFTAAIGYPAAPPDIIAATLPDGIHVVNPDRANGAAVTSIENVAVHECTHAIVASTGVRLPIWLSEGTASYFGGEIKDPAVRLSQRVGMNAVPTLDDLSGSYERFRACSGNLFSLSLVEFILDEYGPDALNRSIRNPEDFRSAFGLSRRAFEEAWTEYLRRYGKN